MDCELSIIFSAFGRRGYTAPREHTIRRMPRRQLAAALQTVVVDLQERRVHTECTDVPFYVTDGLEDQVSVRNSDLSQRQCS